MEDPKTCPICGNTVANVHNGGDGISFVERLDRGGYRAPADGNDQIHLGCLSKKPDSYCLPNFLPTQGGM